MSIKPWHDTVAHQNCGLPVVPFEPERGPHKAKEPRHVMCAGCGSDWLMQDDTELLRVWWSQGAYDGRYETEREREAEKRKRSRWDTAVEERNR